MDLIALLDELDLDYRQAGEHHHARAGWVQINCPFCGVHGFHFGVSLSGHYGNCWRCGPHRLKDALIEAVGLEAVQAVWQDLAKSRQPLARSLATNLAIPFKVQELGEQHKHYLAIRKFVPENLEKTWKIGGIGGNQGIFSWRIFIPIHKNYRVVSWTTRTISKDITPRYRSAAQNQEVVPRNQLLYGWDKVRDAVIVVEGPTDVWRIGPGSVATLGTSWHTEQVVALASVPTRIICFDNEPAAQKRAEALRRALSGYKGRTECVRLSSGDPGEAEEAEIGDLRTYALGKK